MADPGARVRAPVGAAPPRRRPHRGERPVEQLHREVAGGVEHGRLAPPYQGEQVGAGRSRGSRRGQAERVELPVAEPYPDPAGRWARTVRAGRTSERASGTTARSCGAKLRCTQPSSEITSSGMGKARACPSLGEHVDAHARRARGAGAIEPLVHPVHAAGDRADARQVAARAPGRRRAPRAARTPPTSARTDVGGRAPRRRRGRPGGTAAAVRRRRAAARSPCPAAGLQHAAPPAGPATLAVRSVQALGDDHDVELAGARSRRAGGPGCGRSPPPRCARARRRRRSARSPVLLPWRGDGGARPGTAARARRVPRDGGHAGFRARSSPPGIGHTTVSLHTPFAFRVTFPSFPGFIPSAGFRMSSVVIGRNSESRTDRARGRAAVRPDAAPRRPRAVHPDVRRARSPTELGLEPFVQDSQSRSRRGHRPRHARAGRAGRGEAGALRAGGGLRRAGGRAAGLADVRAAVVGACWTTRNSSSLYVPPGMLHGFQALTEQADVCYRIDRPHDPAEDLAVRYDDPELDDRAGRCRSPG